MGLLADHIGRRVTMLALAAALMPLTVVLIASTGARLWLTITLIGISFSVIPAVIWPSTAMLVERNRVGTAFGLINMIQSLGLAMANYSAGWLNDRFDAGPAHPEGYDAKLAMFAALSMAACVSTELLLLHERRALSGGIEARQILTSSAAVARHCTASDVQKAWSYIKMVMVNIRTGNTMQCAGQECQHPGLNHR